MPDMLNIWGLKTLKYQLKYVGNAQINAFILQLLDVQRLTYILYRIVTVEMLKTHFTSCS